MIREDFYNLLEVPQNISLEQSNEIDKLIEQYPYFLSARLLSLIALKKKEDFKYEDILRVTAAYTPSREVLYHLLVKETLRDHIEEFSEDIDTDEVDAELALDSSQDSSEENRVDRKEEEITAIEVPGSEISELEQQIIEEAVSVSLSYELNSDEQVEEPSKENLSVSDNIDEFDKNQMNTFSSWLRRIDNNQDSFLENKGGRIDNIIDQFIKNEPRIGEAKKEFFSPTNIARMSLVEDPDFVTETLAKIYAKQGNLNKAISAFKKLSLKYPEKSTYFAAQIKELEQQLKQK